AILTRDAFRGRGARGRRLPDPRASGRLDGDRRARRSDGEGARLRAGAAPNGARDPPRARGGRAAAARRDARLARARDGARGRGGVARLARRARAPTPRDAATRSRAEPLAAPPRGSRRGALDRDLARVRALRV